MTLYEKGSGTFLPVGGGVVGDWVRPSDWLALPTVNSGDQKFVGLVAIHPGDSNWVALKFTGAYTVDWGDGTATENVATNTQAKRNITFASVSSATLTSRGYRQAIVTVTPQAGQSLTIVDIDENPTGVGLASSNGSLWLDIKMAGANVTSCLISGSSSFARILERFEYVGPSSITVAPTFSATSLRSVVGTTWTSGVTNFSSMFNNCSSLRSIPLLNTAAGTNFSSMFNNCSALQSVPLLNTAAGTNFSAMFASCSALQSVPLLNTAAGTSFSTMFSGCSSLQVGAMAGTSKTISYSTCKLSATQIDAIYTNLASGVAAQTITVTSNWGNATDTPSIATAKGWTVTG